MSVRARTPVEVLVMGKNVFTQVSGALAPLRDALAQTLNRRAVDLLKNRPEVYELLKNTSIKELVDPIPQPLLKPTATIREVGKAFVEHGNEFFFVSADGQNLDGVVTITDLSRSQDGNRAAPVAEFMTKNPVTVALEDDCSVAANTFREYRLKMLPVVRDKAGSQLVGCIRLRRLLAFVLNKTGGGEQNTGDGEPETKGGVQASEATAIHAPNT